MTFLCRVVMLSRSRKFGRYPEASWANYAFGTIQVSIALLVLWSLMHPSRAFAAKARDGFTSDNSTSKAMDT